MTCPTHESLLAFVASELPAAELAAIAVHLDGGCSSCGRAVAFVSELRRLASPTMLEDPPSKTGTLDPPHAVRRSFSLLR